MKKSKLILYALMDAAATVGYTIFIGWFLFGLPKGPINSLWGPVAMLLLFIVSAAVAGGLVLGRPALLYLDGNKKDAVKLFVYTIAFLGIAAVIFVIFADAVQF